MIRSYRTCGRLLRFLILAAALPATVARAQAPGQNALQNASATSGEQRHASDAASATGQAVLTPDALQGPPTPAILYAVAGMDDRQLAQYLAAYRAHMAATWNTRYALMQALKMLNRADQNSDADAVRYYEAVGQQLWRELRNRDQGFELAFSAILRKGQLRRYQEWKAVWQHGAQLQQRLEARVASDQAGDSG